MDTRGDGFGDVRVSEYIALTEIKAVLILRQVQSNVTPEMKE